MTAPLVSAVLPTYNEEELLRDAVGEIQAVLEKVRLPFEIVIVDDGSRDRSGAIADELAAADGRIVPIHFSRNFGKEAALFAGLEAARGQAVLLMDTDLQHPPELIPELIRLWKDEGYDVDVPESVDALRIRIGT